MNYFQTNYIRTHLKLHVHVQELDYAQLIFHCLIHINLGTFVR